MLFTIEAYGVPSIGLLRKFPDKSKRRSIAVSVGTPLYPYGITFKYYPFPGDSRLLVVVRCVGRDPARREPGMETPDCCGEQMVFYHCLDLYHKSPDSGERQYKSRTSKGRSDHAMRAGVTSEGLESPDCCDKIGERELRHMERPLSSELGTQKTVRTRTCSWLFS